MIRTFLENDNPPDDWVLQQDNAPAHTSQVVKNYFDQAGIRTLPWPSRSPDLNPIEHVWDFLSRKVRTRQPQNMRQLTDFLMEEWNRIDQDYLDHLVEGMPWWIGAVLEARGRTTRY